MTITDPERPGHHRACGPARVDLVIAPTPLHPARRLSHELGVQLYFKRDDLTGAGLGGNKLRGLEYLIADALAQAQAKFTAVEMTAEATDPVYRRAWMGLWRAERYHIALSRREHLV